ncbi:Na+/H+ antiporter NapA [Thermosynechococcus sp. NK55a]|jgi:CPA2 family monovalent cation:H+ antiporter-2|uniref:cation:proton antiporter n=1 Tax=unclassified Thermosynechococcus TaxID=2622553 RepID=UPI0003D822BF|nr:MULTISPECIES: cation:proton antiporter [unclassified Thermosynechococcus]AHB89573.1 Na+/H+ antiporter NapA [Thermosynechococcus sp. NK55a]
MTEDFRLVIDLSVVLGAAAVGGLLAALLRQPILLGYLLAGMLVGPTGLGLLREVPQVEGLAQLGVAFLLFALGVSFSLGEIRKVQGVSLGGSALQILLTIAVTTLIAVGVGWVSSPNQGVFLGAVLSLSSTAVVLRSLMDRNELESIQGQIMLGILVVQDLAVGLMIAVLPALNKPAEELGLALGQAVLTIALIAVGAIAAGMWLLPPLLRLLAKTESRELFLLGVVALCLGIALLTQYLGLSIEIGAFIAGLMISEVEYADQTLDYVESIRDIFTTLFFASIGMLIDPVFLWEHLDRIIELVSLVILGKFLITTPIVKFFGYSWKTSLLVGIGLAQIGEFSFVLLTAGRGLGLVSQQVYLLTLGTTAVTLLVTPFLLKVVPVLLELPLLRRLFKEDDILAMDLTGLPQRNHVIVCGYGRVGKSLVKLLQKQNYPVLVIEQSETVINEVRDAQLPYIYGNAASRTILAKAGVDQALGMAIALPDSMSTRLCLKRALEFAPELDVIVRANSDRDIELLYQLGAREVVQPEFEASLELAAHLFFSLGMGERHIQQQVQQVRDSHYANLRGDTPPEGTARLLRQAAQDMNSRWLSVPEDSPIRGMSLAEIQLRQLTGVTLLAIVRADGTEVDYPSGQTRLQGGDRLLIVGQPAEFAACEALINGRVSVPQGETLFLWIMLPKEIGEKHRTIADLHLPETVTIRALRREGTLLSEPSSDCPLMAGDRLLLTGPMDALRRIGDQLQARSTPLPP